MYVYLALLNAFAAGVNVGTVVCLPPEQTGHNWLPILICGFWALLFGRKASKQLAT